MSNQATAASRSLLESLMAQDRHLGRQPSDTGVTTTAQSGPPGEIRDSHVVPPRFVSVGSTDPAPPGSWNPSFLSPAVSTLSEKRKQAPPARTDDDQDDEAVRALTAAKRQCSTRSGDGEIQDDVMFLPMPDRPFRLFYNNAEVLPPYNIPFGLSQFAHLSSSGGIPGSRSSALAIENASGADPAAGSSQRPSQEVPEPRPVHGETPAPIQGRGGDTRRNGGISDARERGNPEGCGGEEPDGTDGDVESEEEGNGGRRRKGKERARPRHQSTTFASSSDISNICGDLRWLDSTMANVGTAVTTFRTALLQMSDAQTMLVNTFVQNSGGSQPGNLPSTCLDRFAHKTELDHRSWKAVGGAKLRGFPKARSEDQNNFAELIRVVTRERMGRATSKSPFVVEKIPSRDEVQEYAAATPNHYACSWDNFRLDLQGTPHSAWNNSVIDVFVKGFIDNKKDLTATEKQIRGAFGSHVKTLISSYKRSAKGSDTIKAWRKAKKTYERQKNMHARRLAICYEHKGLEDAAKILMRLGVQGMSSDESEVDADNFKTYNVREKKWQNPQLADYLRTLDKLHRRERTNPVTGTSQGAEVHRRKLTKTSSKRGAVPRLPKCAYNPDWLKGLNDHDLDHLAATEEEFNWEHTADIKNIACADNKLSDEPGTSYV